MLRFTLRLSGASSREARSWASGAGPAAQDAGAVAYLRRVAPGVSLWFSAEREGRVQKMIAEGRAICIMPERSAVMPGIVTRTVEGMSLEREVVFVTVSGSGTPVEIRKIAQMAARHAWA